MKSTDILNVRDDEVKIDGKPWDDDMTRQLFAKHLFMFQRMAYHNEYLLRRGQDLMDKYDGRIFTEEQIEMYEEVEEKYVIQPPVMKAPIRSLIGHIIKARKSGNIETEAGDLDTPFAHPDQIATMNVLLNDMKEKLKDGILTRDWYHDGFVSCYPTVLLFHKRIPTEDNPLECGLELLPWKSCMFGPKNWRRSDCSDIREIIFVDNRSQAQLEENFPERKDAIRVFFTTQKEDDSLISNTKQWFGLDSAEDRDSFVDTLINAMSNFQQYPGMVPVITHIYPVKTKEEVYINVDDELDYQILPETWDEERKHEWVTANKDKYEGPYLRPATVLYETVFNNRGLVLSHGAHWYQEMGDLPAAFFVPAMLNSLPTGPTVDMAPECLRNAVAEIERLDELRKGGGVMTYIREDTVQNMEALTNEMNKASGVGIVKKDSGPIGDNIMIHNKPDTSEKWKAYSSDAKTSGMELTRLNETMQGAAAPRQANIAKQSEVSLALITSAIYIDNANAAWERFQNLKLRMVPYFYDKNMVIECWDEEAQAKKAQEINVPKYDENGDKYAVVNDVTAHRYRWKMVPVDDTPLQRLQNEQEAMNTMNTVVAPMLGADKTGKMLAQFLASLPNPILNKAGKKMLEDFKAAQEAQAANGGDQAAQLQATTAAMEAQAAIEKARKTGMMFTGKLEDIINNPAAIDVWLKLLMAYQGGVSPQQIQGDPSQPQGAPAPAPAPMAGQPA